MPTHRGPSRRSPKKTRISQFRHVLAPIRKQQFVNIAKVQARARARTLHLPPEGEEEKLSGGEKTGLETNTGACQSASRSLQRH